MRPFEFTRLQILAIYEDSGNYRWISFRVMHMGTSVLIARFEEQETLGM